MNTLRSVSLFALAACAAASQALVLNATNFDVTAVRPTSGTATAAISGTLTVSSPDDQVDSASYYSPFDAGGKPLGFIASSLTSIDIINDALATTGSYTGVFFSFTLDSSVALGRYDLNFFGTPATFDYSSLTGQTVIGNYSVDVVDAAPSVPGPLAALPFALIALQRRKRA